MVGRSGPIEEWSFWPDVRRLTNSALEPGRSGRIDEYASGASELANLSWLAGCGWTKIGQRARCFESEDLL